MKINTKVKIYIRKFTRKIYFGQGIYLGKEKVWKIFAHGAVKKMLKKFKVKDRIIYESECTWEII